MVVRFAGKSSRRASSSLLAKEETRGMLASAEGTLSSKGAIRMEILGTGTR